MPSYDNDSDVILLNTQQLHVSTLDLHKIKLEKDSAQMWDSFMKPVFEPQSYRAFMTTAEESYFPLRLWPLVGCSTGYLHSPVKMVTPIDSLAEK